MNVGLAVVFANCAEEFFHESRRLVHIDDLAWNRTHACPGVSDLARDVNGLSGVDAESLLIELEIELALEEVDPLVLFMMEVARAATCARELEDAHGTIGVVGRDLAVARFAAAQLDVLAEAIFSRGDAETGKHFLTCHFSSSFQMVDGFVDGGNQSADALELLFHDLAVRFEGVDLLEFGASKDGLDLFQLESQLAVEQDLLEDQELRLFVDTVAVGGDPTGLEETRFVVEWMPFGANSPALNWGYARSPSLLMANTAE